MLQHVTKALTQCYAVLTKKCNICNKLHNTLHDTPQIRNFLEILPDCCKRYPELAVPSTMNVARGKGY